MSKVVHSGLQWLTLIYGSLRDLSISNEEFTDNCESVIQLIILQHVDREAFDVFLL